MTIGSLKKLQVLDLEENKLEFLPPEIGTSSWVAVWYDAIWYKSLTWTETCSVESGTCDQNKVYEEETKTDTYATTP